MLKQRGILAGLAVVLAAVVIGFGVTGSSNTAQANHHPGGPDEMTIYTNVANTGAQGTCTAASVPTCTIMNAGPGAGDGDGDTSVGTPSSVVGVPVGGTFHAIVGVNAQAANYSGYQYEVAFLDALVSYVSQTDLDTDLSLCSPPGTALVGPIRVVGLGSGCLSPSAGGAMFNNPVEDIKLMCNAPGNTLVSLIGPDADPTFGSQLIGLGGATVLTTLENQLPNPVPPPTTVAATVVACLQPVDISVVKTGPATANVGDPGTYNIAISNTGPGTVNVDMSDAAPVGTTFTSIDNGPQCTFTAASASCAALPIPAAGSVTVHVGLTFDSCGMKTNSASVQTSSGQSVIDVNPANNSSQAVTNVDCPVISVTKNVAPPTGTAGVTVFNYTISVCNDPGSTAHGVTLSDTDFGPLFGPGNLAGGACQTFTPSQTIPAVGTHCDTATANSSDAGGPLTAQACVTVTPNFPTFNGMRKDCDLSTLSTDTACNIFLSKDPITKVPSGSILIGEQLNLPADVDTCNDDDDGDGAPCAGVAGSPLAPFQDPQDQCGLATAVVKGVTVYPKHYIPRQTKVDCNGGEVPEGLGAIEFQIKYDHKLFTQPVLEGCTFSPNRTMEPQVSVITENWVQFGCVTTDTVPGVKAQGDIQPEEVVATVLFTPQTDLFARIRPTKDNGVVTDLLDENCEAADIHGEPWVGSTQGGLLDECGDATITIRMLEGDVNLDCQVTVADDQAEAFRYGSFFGSLLYNRFFDLEPNIAPDFDIDIKDLQTVFGRNGSTCANPQPLQNPQSQVPDP